MTQHDLETPSVEVMKPPPEITSKIEDAALLVSKCGLWMERRLLACVGNNVDNKTLCFLKSSDPYHAFYKQKLAEYQKNQPFDAHIHYDDYDDEPPLEPSLGVIKLTAQFVVRYGMHFWRDLLIRVINDPRFAFMEPTHSRFSVFSRLIDVYARVLKPYYKRKKLKKPDVVLERFFNLVLEGEKEKQEEEEEEGVEMHAFLGGLDYFADKEGQDQSSPNPPTQMMQPTRSFKVPLPEWPSFPIIYPDEIKAKELGVIKITAQFAARYGLDFQLELMKRVVDDPQFEFMRRRTDRYYFFSWIVGAYGLVLVPLRNQKTSACLETVVEGFLNLFRVEKQGGVEMAMTGLHAFVGGFEDEPEPEPEHSLSTEMQSDAPATHYLQPPPLEKPFRLTLYPEGISFTFKELDVIKLTAQFVGVYGSCFEEELMKSVTRNPQFEFMKSTDNRHDYFLDLALEYTQEYSKELPKVRKNGANTATVVEGFFNILGQVLAKEDEDGEELAFEYFVNDFGSPSPPPAPDPKRQKVSAPKLDYKDDGQVIKI